MKKLLSVVLSVLMAVTLCAVNVSAESFTVDSASTSLSEYYETLTVTDWNKDGVDLELDGFVMVDNLVIEDGASVVINYNEPGQGIEPNGFRINTSISVGTNASISSQLGEEKIEGLIDFNGNITLPDGFYRFVDGGDNDEPITSTGDVEFTIFTYDGMTSRWYIQEEEPEQPDSPEELFEIFVDRIKNREWAYAVSFGDPTIDGTKDEILDKLAREIFNEYVINENRQEIRNPQDGLFYLFMEDQDKAFAIDEHSDRLDVDKIIEKYSSFNNFADHYIEKIKGYIELSDLIADDSGELVSSDDTKLSYFVFVFDFDSEENGNEIVHRVYVLNSLLDFIFVYRVGENKTYTEYSTDGNGFDDVEYAIIPYNTDEYYVIGNGIGDAGQDLLKDGQTKEYHDALALDVSNRGLSKYYTTDGERLGCTFIVYRENFLGAKVNIEKNAAAWSNANYPIYALNGEGSEASIFFDNDEFTISTPEYAPESSNIVDVFFSNSEKEENGSKIEYIDEGEDAGKYRISFGSIFYDSIVIKIQFENEEILPMTLNRVGLYINRDGHHEPNKYTIYHGTNKWEEYSLSENYGNVVYASFYYKGTEEPEERTNLFVTLTYPDNSKETKIIEPINTNIIYDEDLQGTAKYVDDYQIWVGELNESPKIEAIVYVEGDEESFGGVQLGSGAGVTWEER